MSTKNSRATSSSKQRRRAISPASTARVSGAPTTWTFNFSDQSSTNATNTDQDHLVCTYLGNLSSTPTSLKPSPTLREKIKDTLFFLQQMERSLINLTPLWKKLIESYGLTEKIALIPKPWNFSEEKASSGCSSKKHRRRSLKSGKRSRGLK